MRDKITVTVNPECLGDVDSDDFGEVVEEMLRSKFRFEFDFKLKVSDGQALKVAVSMTDENFARRTRDAVSNICQEAYQKCAFGDSGEEHSEEEQQEEPREEESTVEDSEDVASKS